MNALEPESNAMPPGPNPSRPCPQTLHAAAPDDPGPVDPRLETMLDQALTPERAPGELSRRVVAATGPLLPRARGPWPWVLARLGPPLRVAAAVALLAAATAGVWLFKPGATEPTFVSVPAAASPVVAAMAFSDRPRLPRDGDRLAALVIITQTSDLVGRPPASLDEAAAWSRSDPLAF